VAARSPRPTEIPPYMTVEREYDSDHEATVSALVGLVNYAQSRNLAATCDPVRGRALVEEAGLDMSQHTAICCDPDCWFCCAQEGTATTNGGDTPSTGTEGRPETAQGQRFVIAGSLAVSTAHHYGATQLATSSITPKTQKTAAT
jgi:hypothetical protein